ncbi:hormogonium polysaccharide secretion pseudopilin HpsB [Aphanizomenon flos-aquae NRERC-008]|uniref:Prepilin-type N-terminal cleavage/methylation domain-containing protein n=1 Tax=Aphanizomenon flos-aquae FACHB-1249 TaxID=2692889 RepID=A0ABR8IM19_APHFL|nr:MULTISPECIES: hormogonium polysaccharide secretion pseudopilin HpsB [Aphanizomenon]MBD2389457.1 prepilin-type N-terminal cleavage/methylation domain-containing protein [Aphanizomenon flos-aquae FACHB-1171]MBD2555931.1 prepilin-type N-terminal cleavage/methylation domain-containing protein [Aphanizomenon flos-aquae FACHB-1290]MBD2632014.1 prepilin-type N-terminal cleavage/methylation domain-containing protein [Aphanizomenon sp. FACHB-1399]MBD2641908.1 prepilin-type N-terminal cleavage/methyla
MMQLPQKHNINKDAGFTIMESLIAMVVVSSLMLAISPVLILSASTRVQSRRVELSAQIARSFIDGVRSGRIKAEDITTVNININQNALSSRNITNSTDGYLISSASMAAPTSETKKYLYCVQSDGTILPPDCSSNQNNLFYIQAGRTSINNSGTNDGYRLAVRVYRKDIDFDKTVLANTNNTKNTQAVVGSGNKQAPLVEIIADIANNNTSFTDLCNRLGFRAGSATIPCS